MKKLMQKKSNRRGAALVEYAMIIAGVTLVSAAAVSVFGHKTNDMVAATAAVLPGAHAADNGAITSGHLLDTKTGTSGIEIDTASVIAGTNVLGANVLGATDGTEGVAGLVVEPQ